MATTITKLIFTILFMKIQMLVKGQQQVPCLFLFGDSLLDNGNNNVLVTRAKVNYQPYGIDFPGGPTGRFSNGKNIADFLAQFLGFQNPVPPFVNTRGSDILKGLNYASGAAGILDDSGAQLGDVFTMNEQLLNHQVTIGRITGLLSNRTTTNEYLRQCLYIVNMGNNDYINNYYLQKSTSRLLFTPAQFADILIQKFNQQLRTSYNLGLRKIAVFGVGLIGCIPQELALYPTNEPCVTFINKAVGLFNNKLFSLITDLNNNLPGSRFTYINVTSISSADPTAAGFTVLNAPCCVVERSTGQCVRNQTPCTNRNEYVFFDNFHPTELVNAGTASRAYSALLPADASPVDIKTLAMQ